MGNLKLRLLKGNFREEMKARIASFAPYTSVSVKLIVPYSLRWWYWLEYGTAYRAEAGHGSGSEYPIVPIEAAHLRFPDPEQKYGPNKDGFHVTDLVMHPGIRPRHIVRGVLDDINADAALDLQAFFRTEKLRADELLHYLTNRMMVKALGHITRNMAIQAPDNRFGDQDGWARLHGEHAAEVFQREAEILDSSK